jgi:hypothetical protein
MGLWDGYRTPPQQVNPPTAKLVAAAFGMDPEGVMIHLADHIDHDRLDSRPLTQGAT